MINPRVIKRFEVSKLFDLNDYKLDLGTTSTGENIHESLLYGDNGTGKTTLLKLMYHTLSKNTHDGSRTFLARTPFRRLAIELTGGQAIEIIKTDLRGVMHIACFDGQSSTTITLVPNEKVSILGGENPDTSKLELFLASLKIEQLYLSDDRRIMSTYRAFNRVDVRRNQYEEEVLRRRGERFEPNALTNFDLDALGERVKDIIRDKLIERSVFGQYNVNNIYLELARRFGKPAASAKKSNSKEALLDFENRIKMISSEYSTASSLQIFPEVNFDEFVQVVRNAGSQQSNTIEIIDTYLDTVEARIKAVKDLADLLNVLVDEINSYLVNKRLQFSIRDGFRIISRGSNLRFVDLSSGEKQLLFLMLLLFTTRDDRSVVYIDEPELSLNIKWQRQLISSLSKIIDGTETQLIAATHSFEILAKHRSALIPHFPDKALNSGVLTAIQI